MDYRVIYDATGEGFGGWSGLIFNLLFLASLVLGLIRHDLIRRLFGGWGNKYILWFGVIVTLLDMFFAFYDEAVTSQKVKAALRDGSYETTEGQITDYQKRFEPPLNSPEEYFIVNGIKFPVGGDMVEVGFRTRAQEGSPLSAGEVVRIAYVKDEGRLIIIRLELLAP